jgi:hypothetical protein
MTDSASFKVTVDPHVLAPELLDSIPIDFVRCGSYGIVNSASCNLAESFPPFVAIRPLAPGQSLPVIDCSHGDYPRCGTCHAFLYPFCQVNPVQRSWRCALCTHLNSTIHFTSLFDMRVKITDRPELHHICYDLLPPPEAKAIRGQARVFMFVVDETLISSEALADAIASSLRWGKPTDRIGLISFAGSVTIFDLNSGRGRAFGEFDPSLFPQVKTAPVFVNAESCAPVLLSALKSLRPGLNGNALGQALEWAALLMSGFGGRLVLFTGGRCLAPPADLLQRFQDDSISLSVFRTDALPALEKWAELTGGIVCPFRQVHSLCSLFAVESAWDASASFRCSPGVKVTKVLGKLSLLANDVALFPVITSAESVMYELRSEANFGNFHFQFAIRFTDDNGVRRVRVINGRLPFVDVIKLPIDDSAMALFLNRKRMCEQQEELFFSRVSLSKGVFGASSLFHVAAYVGSLQDRNFLLGTSVEAFGLSVFCTTVELNGAAFRVVWAPGVTIVYPAVNREQEQAIWAAAHHFGLNMAVIMCPASEAEFLSMTGNDAQASQWYANLPVFTRVRQ